MHKAQDAQIAVAHDDLGWRIVQVATLALIAISARRTRGSSEWPAELAEIFPRMDRCRFPPRRNSMNYGLYLSAMGVLPTPIAGRHCQ